MTSDRGRNGWSEDNPKKKKETETAEAVKASRSKYTTRKVFFKPLGEKSVEKVFFSTSPARARRQHSRSFCGGTAQQTPVSESGGDASAWLEALRRKMADEVAEASKRMVENL